MTKNQKKTKLKKFLKAYHEGERVFDHVKLNSTDLSYQKLQDISLYDANLNKAKLNNTNLQDSDLGGAKLTEAQLHESNLKFSSLWLADLKRADLQDADLRHAFLMDANLQGAKLQGTALSRAQLKDADFRGADLDEGCWPLWCGSLNAIIDRKIFLQILGHALASRVLDKRGRPDPVAAAARVAFIDLLEEYHQPAITRAIKARMEEDAEDD